MSALITGASGFVGRSLASALLGDGQLKHLTLTDLQEPSQSEPRLLTKESFAQVESSTKVSTVAADLTTREGVEDVFFAAPQGFSLVYILHGLMSGDSEANHELSMKVNLDATRNLLVALAKHCPGARVVYTSSCAVFGPQDQDEPGNKTKTITEDTKPQPQGTYGTHKAMMELFVDDMCRRGSIDAVIVRLPTVIVRAGKPTGAASSFASGMFREPLQGLPSVLPVRRELEIWICSARTVTRNLIIAGQIRADSFKPNSSRIVFLPGSLVTVSDMIDALHQVGGDKAVALLQSKPDEKTVSIVEGWATRISDSFGQSLGFINDHSLVETVNHFVEDYLPASR